MAVRRLLIAFLLAGFGLPSSWAGCPQDAVPSGVGQLERELGARPFNVVVRELHLVNVLRTSVDEQQQISELLAGFCFRSDKRAELDERIRDAFQRLGFFSATVADVEVNDLDRRVDPPSVSVTARIQEGDRYRLKEIKFKGNKAISDSGALRSIIPMKDADWFNIEQVRQGIKALKDVYGELGFINFTPIPDFQLDNEQKLIVFTIDIDEGAQYRIESVTIRAADERRKAALQSVWPEDLQPGRVFNSKAVELFFKTASDLLPPDASPDHNLHVAQDNEKHTVNILLIAVPN